MVCGLHLVHLFCSMSARCALILNICARGWENEWMDLHSFIMPTGKVLRNILYLLWLGEPCFSLRGIVFLFKIKFGDS